MKRYTHLFRILAVIFIIALVPALSSCGSGASGASQDAGAADAEASGARPVERVLHAIMDYPNDELYHPTMTYIGLDAPAPTAEEIAAAEKAAEEEKAAWEAAIGDCFADGMFDTFYGHYERTGFLGEAYALKLTTMVTDIRLRDADGGSGAADVSGADQDTDPTEAENATPDSTSEESGDGKVETLTVTLKATDETGHTDIFDTVWLVKYDKTDPELLQSVKLLVDGGFFCRTGCPI